MWRKSMKKLRKITAIITILCCTTFSGCTKEVGKDVTKDQEASNTQLGEEVAFERTDTEIETENLIQNGTFATGSEGWGVFVSNNGEGDFVCQDEEGRVNITAPGSTEYAIQLYYDGFKMELGGVYKLSFEASSTVERTVIPRIQLNGGDYKAYFEDTITLTPEKQTFDFEFTMQEASDPAPRLCFNAGKPRSGETYDAHQLCIDNVGITLLDGSAVIQTEEQDNIPNIQVNQVGYTEDATKIAVIRGSHDGEEFQVLDADGTSVLTKSLSDAQYNDTADEMNYYADFSEVTTPGIYTISVKNEEASFPFTIGDEVYKDCTTAVFRMLYLQRCGCELSQESAEKFAHPICHDTEALIYGTEETKEVSGGWHDAGDYGRYVVPGAVTVADLLLTYEQQKECLDTNHSDGDSSDAFDIPESKNGTPDLLDEARYELEWMLKMQAQSGGVYHKVSTKSFPDFMMPDADTDPLVLSPISTTATADFAAVMAMSYRCYLDQDKAFANTCLKAAKQAWQYLELTKNGLGFQNPSDIVTGEYGDGQDKDERYWAAVELYGITKESKYQTYIEESLDRFVLHGLGWQNVGTYGNMRYLDLDASLRNPVYEEKLQQAIIEKGQELLTICQEDGYGISIGEVYSWGSNGTIANNARMLSMAAALDADTEYEEAICNHLHFIMGRNPVSTCFITGYGTLSPKDTHHRPSSVQQETMKGMLAGGINSNLEDPYAKSVLVDAPPAKCYVDNMQSYSCNEVTIYWNSPLLALLYEIESLQS